MIFMIFDLKKSILLRGLTFEVISEYVLRKEKCNGFIFRTKRFANLNVLLDYYKLDASKIKNIGLLESYYNSVDLIEFVLDDFKNRAINSIVLYEVKTKNNDRPKPIDIAKSCHNRFLELSSSGFETKIIFISIFENWKFSFNIHDYQTFNSISLRKDRFRR